MLLEVNAKKSFDGRLETTIHVHPRLSAAE